MKSTLNLIDNKFLIVVTSIVICSFAFCDPRMEIAVSDIDKTVESCRSYAMERLKICEKNNGIFDHLEMLKEFIVQYEKTATDPDNENALLCPVVDFSLKNIEISQTTDNMSFEFYEQYERTHSFLQLKPLSESQIGNFIQKKGFNADNDGMIESQLQLLRESQIRNYVRKKNYGAECGKTYESSEYVSSTTSESGDAVKSSQTEVGVSALDHQLDGLIDSSL